jgi:hypothetical protein
MLWHGDSREGILTGRETRTYTTPERPATGRAWWQANVLRAHKGRAGRPTAPSEIPFSGPGACWGRADGAAGGGKGKGERVTRRKKKTLSDFTEVWLVPSPGKYPVGSESSND